MLTDTIAKLIEEMLNDAGGSLELQRNEMANRLGCVPSQISYVITSRFTPDAKRILDDMSDKIVGYDGNDLYETAKECEFGLIKKNGEWALDEKLLSGPKAFFNMF